MLVVAVVALSAVLGGIFVGRRFRARARPRTGALERALQARQEQALAQERATRMHPDCVRPWMRPR
jgi:hypothetical protein